MKSSGGGPSILSDSVVEYVLTREVDEFETLNVSTVARIFKVNRSYLSQRFKMDKQISLHEYILMIKILRSLALLERENITVEALSRKMGFSSPDYFRRIFKGKVGTTPGKYKSFFRNSHTPKKTVETKG